MLYELSCACYCAFVFYLILFFEIKNKEILNEDLCFRMKNYAKNKVSRIKPYETYIIRMEFKNEHAIEDCEEKKKVLKEVMNKYSGYISYAYYFMNNYFFVLKNKISKEQYDFDKTYDENWDEKDLYNICLYKGYVDKLVSNFASYASQKYCSKFPNNQDFEYTIETTVITLPKEYEANNYILLKSYDLHLKYIFKKHKELFGYNNGVSYYECIAKLKEKSFDIDEKEMSEVYGVFARHSKKQKYFYDSFKPTYDKILSFSYDQKEDQKEDQIDESYENDYENIDEYLKTE